MRSISRTRRVASAFLAVLALASFDIHAQRWVEVPGQPANDVGVGPTGEVWVVGTDNGAAGSSIYRLSKGKFIPVPGQAVRIDVGPGGPWIVDKQGLIAHWNGSGWTRVAGLAKDVGIGGDKVWVIGSNDEIYRYTGTSWERFAGSAVRIDVDRNGVPWVVNAAGAIYKYDNARFVQVPGPPALDIGIGGDSVYIVDTNHGLHKYEYGGWKKLEATLTTISADDKGHPWGLTREKLVLGSAVSPDAPPPAPPPPPTPMMVSVGVDHGNTSQTHLNILAILAASDVPAEVTVFYGPKFASSLPPVTKAASTARQSVRFSVPQQVNPGETLKPGTPIYFRVRTTSSRGSVEQSGNGPATPGLPYIEKIATADVTRTNAVLIAHADTYGRLAQIQFELSKDAKLATKLPFNTFPAKPQSGVVPSRAPGVALEPNTTYYYRAIVTNQLGELDEPDRQLQDAALTSRAKLR